MKIIVKNRSGHDMSHMGPYLKSFLPYAQKRMGFNRPPTIFFDSDPQNAENVLGKTAYYNPETEEIVVFVDKRHPKDILRSLSHELVHHSQNCRGDLNPEIAGETTPGYAQTNAHMRAMEGEAYLKGNGYYFRDWEDSLKNGLEETNYKHITGDIHKMATYDQLKEEITAKVVAALTEKLANKIEEEAKPDFLDLDKDGDTEEPMKKAAEEAEEMNEAEEVELNEEEIEERKKRDTPRDSDRREPEKLKMNEEEQLEEMHCGGKRHDDLDPGMRCPMCGHIVMAEAEELEEAQEELEEVQEEEVVEETISNDEWYQSELFESLKKRWTK
jgi:rubredoxin